MLLKKASNWLIFEFHEAAGRRFLCLINKVAEETNFAYILDFYALYLFHNSVFLYRTWYRDSTRVVVPEYGKISISKSWSNVRILTSTATHVRAEVALFTNISYTHTTATSTVN